MDVREKLVELLRNAKAAMKSENLSCDIARNMFVVDFMMANGVTVQEWISVKDRLPTREDANETESILAINKDGRYVGRWVWDIVARWPTEFTYWMPIPQPPKGE